MLVYAKRGGQRQRRSARGKGDLGIGELAFVRCHQVASLTATARARRARWPDDGKHALACLGVPVPKEISDLRIGHSGVGFTGHTFHSILALFTIQLSLLNNSKSSANNNPRTTPTRPRCMNKPACCKECLGHIRAHIRSSNCAFTRVFAA